MRFAKFKKGTLAVAFFAVSLIGAPVAAHAQEPPSGTGKTLAAVTLASQVEVDSQDTGNLVGSSATDGQASDPEWKYVNVRR